MSILEKIKSKKDVYIYIRQKAREKKSELLPQTTKLKSADNSWHYWLGVELNCNQIIADLEELEKECEMAFNSIEIDLSALRGK